MKKKKDKKIESKFILNNSREREIKAFLEALLLLIKISLERTVFRKDQV
jgi:hypothetical protein